MVRVVGLKILKNRLSEYVRLASGGETFLISDRDKVVAELIPPQATRSRSLPDALLADAVRTGLITPALRPNAPLSDPLPVAPLDQIMRGLSDDREDR